MTKSKSEPQRRVAKKPVIVGRDSTLDNGYKCLRCTPVGELLNAKFLSGRRDRPLEQICKNCTGRNSRLRFYGVPEKGHIERIVCTFCDKEKCMCGTCRELIQAKLEALENCSAKIFTMTREVHRILGYSKRWVS